MKFYNPYNFVPFSSEINGKVRKDEDYKRISGGQTAIRHDAWFDEFPESGKLFSGRIIAKVEVLSPTVVGSAHQDSSKEKKTPSIVEPYTRDGNYALPGSSLRGMISAVTEAISQSNMRVLHNQAYSARVNPKESHDSDQGKDHILSAIGQLVKEDDQYFIRPLKLPAIKLDNSKKLSIDGKWKKWKVAFGPTATLGNAMGFYVTGLKHSSRSVTKDDFLDRENPVSFDPENPVYYQAKEDHAFNKFNEISVRRKCTKSIHTGKQKAGFLLAQGVLSTDTEIKKLADDTPADPGMIKGIIYALGEDEQLKESNSLPKTKTKQWFIPYDEKEIDLRPKLSIPDSVIEIWHAIAEARFNESKGQYPLTPRGRDKTKAGEPSEFQPLRDGDLVYFDVEDEFEPGQKPKVTALSFSGIWRIPLGHAHQYFTGHLPLGAKSHTNDQPVDTLSPAEQLFGCVDAGGGKKALASRIRVGDGLSLQDLPYDKDKNKKYLLRNILASPKAPSPAMYFKPASNLNSGFISKAQMSEWHQHNKHNQAIPNGWKRYLPRTEPLKVVENELHDVKESKQFKRPHLHMQVTPIAAGSKFYFPIGFDNLSFPELELLLKALAPRDDFVHRLGLGKSLGLGMVRVEVCRLLTIDRWQRYTEPDFMQTKDNQSQRYASAYTQHEASEQDLVALRKRFPLEFNKQLTTCDMEEFLSKNNESLLLDASLIDKTSLDILLKLGDPTKLEDVTVTYPRTTEQLNSDNKSEPNQDGFKWFTENNKSKHSLERVSPVLNEPLPTLDSN